MTVNLFPAILIAGPPHSGKSVLAYWLSQRLRAASVDHYLLRAAPDGEGDWFLEADPAVTRTLRFRAKRGYSPAFVAQMQEAIETRPLPLLVDVGGLPQGAAQLGLLQACTHVILLYRTPDERAEWQARLAPMALHWLAALQSTQTGPEQIEAEQPYLTGKIAGLARQAGRPPGGPAWQALAARVTGICAYDPAFLEARHAAQARYRLLSLPGLAQQVGLPPGGWWQPAQLPQVLRLIPGGAAVSLYGRGPAWLAGGLAAHARPGPVELFDMRYGWVPALGVRWSRRARLPARLRAIETGAVLEIDLPPQAFLEPGDLALPRPPAAPGGLVISGKLPLWAFAALGRSFAPLREWVGIYELRMKQAIVIHSNSPSVKVGDTIQVNPENDISVDKAA